jgi:predicted amidohydrolase
MKEQLRVSLVQSALSWEDRTSNLQRFDRHLERLAAGDTDIVVLPEMFTTGFTMNATAMAEPTNGNSLRWMKAQAARLDAVVTGSIIAEEGGLCFNRLLWVQPNGHYYQYDKRHLFTLAKEEETYTAGREQLIVEWRGWKIMPLICYDLRFPVWSRNQFQYDLLLYVANWPSMRRAAWRSLLTARAIENQAYTIGVNRVGEDGNGYPHSGDSSVHDYAGETLLHCAEVEGVFTVPLDKGEQAKFRDKLRFLADQDSFSIDFGF